MPETKWRLVPFDPTEDMGSASPIASAIWHDMLAASPDPCADEALVEKMARTYADAWSDDITTYLGMHAPRWDAMQTKQQDAMRRITRAVLPLFSGAPGAQG